MKLKNTDILFNKENQLLITKNNKNPIVFLICSILGICFGVVCETINNAVYTTISVYYVDYINSLNDYSFGICFLNYLGANSVLIILAMLSGLCAVGDKFLYVIPFIKGLGVGCVSGYVYSTYALKGVLYCAVTVFPASLILMTALILACSESVLMSKDILSLIEQKETEETEISINFYFLRYCIITIILIISSLIYALMSYVLSSII